ncbi:MAG: hypothetical protein CSA38_02355 [Flavobacteriales bacterium]|nr:MAG: hypothetical protein CSA38_02355 [Flavobacteriales bacterium]
MFSLVQIHLNAQNENLDAKIKQYTHKVDSIVTSEKQKMNAEINAWDSRLKKQEVSNERFQQEKKKIAEKYQQKMNAKIENERNLLDEITKKQVQKSIYSKSPIIKQEKTKNSIHLKSGDSSGRKEKFGNILVSYSITNLTGNDFNVFNKNSGLRIGNTHSMEIYYRRTHQLGKAKNPFFIHYGLAYRTDTYMPKKSNVFVEENDRLFLEEFEKGRLKRSKLRNVYILAPLEFSYKINKWTLGLGGYAGINTRNIIKVKYYDENDKFKKYKTVIDNGVNPYLVGGKLSLSYRGFTLFLKKDFTPVFNDKAELNYKNNVQFGIVLANIGG